MDKQMQALIDAPLADPLKLYLPLGKRSGVRGQRLQHVDNIAAEKLTGKQVQERKVDAYSAKICQLLDYYATTDIPVERVAEHVGLDVEKTAEALKRRGRALAA